MHQQLWEEGCVGYYNDGSDISTGVHVDDFAELFVLALEEAPAGLMYYGGASDYTRKELALALSLAYGYGGKIRSWTLEEAKTHPGRRQDVQIPHRKNLPHHQRQGHSHPGLATESADTG